MESGLKSLFMENNKKILKAVAPFHHPGYLNFKQAPFEAWKQNGGMVAKDHFPPRFLHGVVYRWELPTMWRSRKEARLRFVEPVSLSFDSFPDYARYEVVPMFWDCWPCYFEKTAKWLLKYQVKTAIFSSRQTAELMRELLPHVHIIWCPEAVDDAVYQKGKLLKDREIDLLEFGRSNEKVFDANKLEAVFDKQVSLGKQSSLGKGGAAVGLNHVCTKQHGKFIYTNEQLFQAMGNAKVTIALPRSLTQPEMAGDIETLTQRYWECMFSRMVMVGHAPQELIDFIGYNPVIELRDDISTEDLIRDVLEHVEDYQALVDRNLEIAQRLGSWEVRMKWLMGELEKYYQAHEC